MNITSVGIIGLGHFGQLVARHIPEGVEIRGFSRSNKAVPGVKSMSFAEVAQADIVILCVPLGSLASTLAQLADHLPATSLLVDVCSVKLRPAALIQEHLPNHHNILLTHPLFGPQSAAKGLQGHNLIVTKSSGTLANEVLAYCDGALGLQILHMSSDEHDRAMAEIHALTFFLARGLGNLNLPAVPVMTPSFQMLLNLITFNSNETEELFQTIQQGNPYAAEIRERMIASLQATHQNLQ